MMCLSEFQQVGFDEGEIVAFLRKHGIEINTDVTNSSRLPADTFPYWKQLMALLPTLTDSEVVSAFADIDLSGPEYLSDDEETELGRWRTVIHRAIQAGELLASVTDPERAGDSPNWHITPANLVDWCATHGLAYPLPTVVGMPSTDAGLREALLACEQDRAKWKSKANELAESGDRIAALVAQVKDLQSQLRSHRDEIDSIASERDKLKRDALAGKAKTTALKIIGGMVISAYGMNIHGDRLEGISEIVTDLERAGAVVTEKTLREWLKEAATVIDRSR